MLTMNTITYTEFDGEMIAGVLNEKGIPGMYRFTKFVKPFKGSSLVLPLRSIDDTINRLKQYRATKDESFLTLLEGRVKVPVDRADELERELIVISSAWSQKII